jgi:hypothetical protein
MKLCMTSETYELYESEFLGVLLALEPAFMLSELIDEWGARLVLYKIPDRTFRRLICRRLTRE